jgi:hypothetical protein
MQVRRYNVLIPLKSTCGVLHEDISDICLAPFCLMLPKVRLRIIKV